MSALSTHIRRVVVTGIVATLGATCLAPVSEAATPAASAQLQKARTRAAQLSSVTPKYCDKNSMSSWQRRTGVAPGVISIFLDSRSWTRISDPVHQVDCWSPAVGPAPRLAVAVPLLPSDGSGSLSKGAAGNYDQYFRKLGTDLVAHGASNAYLRVGWEFNGDWQPWRAGANKAAFVAYYKRVITIFRSIPGAKFSFVWSLTTGPTETDARSVYPGDSWVDVIGLDTYDVAFTSDTYPLPQGASAGLIAARREAAWAEVKRGVLGLDIWSAFAKQHKKRLAVTEWGLVGNVGPGSEPHGGGDNPAYIRNMYLWMKSQGVVFAIYFNAPANYLSTLGRDHRGRIPFPNSTRAYTSAFHAPKSLPRK